MKKLIKHAIVATLLAFSLNASAKDIEYRTFNGVKVGKLGSTYFATAGPFLFEGEATETGFDFPLGIENACGGGLSIIYDKDDLSLSLVPENTFANVIYEYLINHQKKHPNATFLSRIIFDNNEDFACPVVIYPENQSIELSVSNATYSSKVEEIGTDRFNTWSTIKYLASRLIKHKIIAIEFACDDPDDEFSMLCNINVYTDMEDIGIDEALQAMAKASGDHDFIRYSWETE